MRDDPDFRTKVNNHSDEPMFPETKTEALLRDILKELKKMNSNEQAESGLRARLSVGYPEW